MRLYLISWYLPGSDCVWKRVWCYCAVELYLFVTQEQEVWKLHPRKGKFLKKGKDSLSEESQPNTYSVTYLSYVTPSHTHMYTQYNKTPVATDLSLRGNVGCRLPLVSHSQHPTSHSWEKATDYLRMQKHQKPPGSTLGLQMLELPFVELSKSNVSKLNLELTKGWTVHWVFSD